MKHEKRDYLLEVINEIINKVENEVTPEVLGKLYTIREQIKSEKPTGELMELIGSVFRKIFKE